jgi:Domain of unknown function (DUF4234)
MAQEIELGRGGLGKIRSFWVGGLLAVLTVGIYTFCWYYFVNDELKDVGTAKNDPNLSSSSPMNSVIAVLVGGFVLVPPLLSVYNYGQRIKRAQRISGVPRDREINPIAAFLLYFPGGILVIPAIVHYWYVTKHQNIALRAAAGLPAFDEPAELPAT